MLQVLSAAVFFIPFALFSRYPSASRGAMRATFLIVTLLIRLPAGCTRCSGARPTPRPSTPRFIATLGPAFTLIMDHRRDAPRASIIGRVSLGVVCGARAAPASCFSSDGFSADPRQPTRRATLFVLVGRGGHRRQYGDYQAAAREAAARCVVMGWYYHHRRWRSPAPFFWKYIDHVPFLRASALCALAETGLYPDPGNRPADVPALPRHGDALPRCTRRSTATSSPYRDLATTRAQAQHQDDGRSDHLLAGGLRSSAAYCLVVG